MTQEEDLYKRELERRKIYQAMLQNAMQGPSGTQMVSGRAVQYSPIQGLAQIGRVYFANKGMERSRERERRARAEEERKRQESLEKIMGVYKGIPKPYEMPEEQQFDGEEIPGLQTAGTPDRETAMMMAATDPYVRDTKLATVMQAMEKQGRGGYFTPKDVTIDGKTVPMVFDHRKGEWKVDESQGMLSPKYAPSVKKALKEAEVTGKSEAERAFGMTGIGEAIDEARTILTTGSPTESGIGQAVDWIGRQVGVSSKSAQQAAQLEAIGGALTAKMPRMEGPQSDYDREYYQQMAGKVGDRSVPVPERLKALESMEQLWRKYEKLNTVPPGVKPKKEAPPQAIEFLRNNNTPEMQQKFKQKYGYLP